MKTNLLKIDRVAILSQESQRMIKGQAGIDLSLCGCSCSGGVSSPSYCGKFIICPQIYAC
ncbi:hypothetical protein [Aquimarina rubra]|uniref:hypothetical protein n=1 Tax=Aquimarina rubra TaxID=1920033 RepID=UPI00366FB95A